MDDINKIIEENKYLKEFIGGISINKIIEIQEENKILKDENDDLKNIEDRLNKAHADAIKAINKNHSDGLNRQRGALKSRIDELEVEISMSRNEVKVAKNKLAKLEDEVSMLRSENTRLEADIKDKEIKLDILLYMKEKMDSIFDMIRKMVESGADREQVVEKMNEVKNESTRLEKVKALIELESQGFTSAKDLLPRLESVGVKNAPRISELRRSKEYKELKQEV